MEREKGLKRHKKTTGNKKRKQETKDNERRGKDRECKSKAEEPGNRGKDHVKYTIPKETLHFLRFPKLMYYHMGVHPPPIQKLSHGDVFCMLMTFTHAAETVEIK